MKSYPILMRKLRSIKHIYLYSYSELEAITGVPRNTIARMFNGENIGVHAFFQVMEGLGLMFHLEDEDIRGEKIGI